MKRLTSDTRYQFSDLLEIVSLDVICEMLQESETSMDRRRVYNPEDPFTWIKGVHWFQPRDRGRITYNKKMIAIWLAAVSQGDAKMHQSAILEYQRSFPARN